MDSTSTAMTMATLLSTITEVFTSSIMRLSF